MIVALDPKREAFALETERLRLCVPGEWAAPALLAFLERNRERFAAASPLPPPGGFTLERCAEGLRQAQAAYLAGSALSLRLFPRDDRESLIGDVSLTNIVRGPFQACHLGYRIDAAYEGQSLMSEALRAVIAHALGTLNLHRIMANYVPTNERSARLLGRLGFSVEGYARDYLFLEGRWKDHCLTSLINPSHRFEGDGTPSATESTKTPR